MGTFKVVKKRAMDYFEEKSKIDQIMYAVNAGGYGIVAAALELFKRSGRTFSDGSYFTLFNIIEPAAGIASLTAAAALVMTAIAKKAGQSELDSYEQLPNFEDHTRGGR